MKTLKFVQLMLFVLTVSGVFVATKGVANADDGGSESHGNHDSDDNHHGGDDDDHSGSGSMGSDSGNGSPLYAQSCASCHGVSSSLRGNSVSTIGNAISRNKGGMGYLVYLSASDIQSIAGYINGIASGTGAGAGTGTSTGAALYSQYCSGCHGVNGKQGATATRISNAIRNNVGGMSHLSSLLATQIQDIANYLTGAATTQTPISGDRVFAYAEANYPSIFTEPGTAGQYQQYNYRYYPASGNYLAVDTYGVIYILGPHTHNVVTEVGPVESFRVPITAWEAAP